MRYLQANNRDWYRITNKATNGDAPEVFIYGEVGWDGITADDLIRDLAAIDADQITVRVNSPGGSVFGGIAIYNALRTHKAKVTVLVDSIAASVASVIAQAGDERVMVQHSQMMIHEAQGLALGSGTEIREYADLLDTQTDLIANIYAERSGKSERVFRSLMEAETWFTAEDAVAEGLADSVMIPERQEAENKIGDPAATTVAPPVEDLENKADDDDQGQETNDPPPPPERVEFGDLFDRNPFKDLLERT
jgi:ATP-dependent Clp endopeptidase proteolytic subunit ClpP